MAPTRPPKALLDLPTEMYEVVCKMVDSTKELRNLRITCRDLHVKTDAVFKQRQFSEIEINLTRENLTYLCEVSKHDKLRGLVTALVITPRYPPIASNIPEAVFTTAISEHTGWGKFCISGADAKLLGAALRGLSKLERIEIKQWRSHLPGWSGGIGQPHFITPIGHAFAVVLQALNQPGLSTSLCQFRVGHASDGLLRNAVEDFSLPSQIPSNARCQLARLKELHLSIKLGIEAQSLFGERRLAYLLAQVSNLQILKLQFWRFYVDFLCETLTNITLPRLKHFHLEACRQVSCEQLRSFVQRHEHTLKTLIFVNMVLHGDDTVDVFPTIFAGLRLSEVRLQQIGGRSSDGAGLLVMGADTKVICRKCIQDLDAIWWFREGPACEHASVVAKGEHETCQVLEQRLRDIHVLPYSDSGDLIPVKPLDEDEN